MLKTVIGYPFENEARSSTTMAVGFFCPGQRRMRIMDEKKPNNSGNVFSEEESMKPYKKGKYAIYIAYLPFLYGFILSSSENTLPELFGFFSSMILILLWPGQKNPTAIVVDDRASFSNGYPITVFNILLHHDTSFKYRCSVA